MDFASIDGTKVPDWKKADFLKANYPEIFKGRTFESIRNTIRAIEREISDERSGRFDAI